MTRWQQYPRDMAFQFPAPVSHINGVPVREYEVVYQRPNCHRETAVIVALSPESAGEIIQDGETEPFQRYPTRIISVTDIGPGLA